MLSDDPVILFVFGSYSKGGNYNDIDLLVLYRKEIIDPRDIVFIFSPIKKRIAEMSDKPVHCTFLSREEETQVGFIESNSCIPAYSHFCHELKERLSYFA